MDTFKASSFFDPRVRVVDARMGRGKSTAAMRYMEEEAGRKRFLYITPYLTEVSRVCECCDFEEPMNDGIPDDDSDGNGEERVYLTKSAILKDLMRLGKNVATTHSLFSIMDEEARTIAREMGYCLIIDEAISVIRKVPLTFDDAEALLKSQYVSEEDGKLLWRNEHYTGKFWWVKRLIEGGSVYRSDVVMMDVLNPDLIRSFDEVWVLTYRFIGSILHAYLQSFGFEYEIYGIKHDDAGPMFREGPDRPPAIDYTTMIDLERSAVFNKPGDEAYCMAKSWYKNRHYKDQTVKQLRKNMINFLRRDRGAGAKGRRMWTCFKDYRDLLVPENGACRSNFVPLNTKATNVYKDCTRLAYMVNRYIDPNIIKFFARRGVQLDRDGIALSEMLQWIWRSAIRDGQPIHLYVPSYRMRELLYNWMLEEKHREEKCA